MPAEGAGVVLARRRIVRRDLDEASPEHLFRPEALRRRHEVGQPRPLAIAPPGWSIVTAVLLAAAAAVVAFLCLGSFSRKEIAVGTLRPANGEAIVTVDRPGVVLSLYVRENQRVRAGDPLFDVRTEATLLDGRTLASASLDSIEAQDLIARRQAWARDLQAQAELARLRLEEAAGRSTVGGLASRHALAMQRRSLAEEQVRVGRVLAAKGFMSGQDLRRREDAALSSRMEEEQYAADLAKAREAQAGFDVDARRLRAKATGDAADAAMMAAQLHERRLAATQDRGFRVRAPIDGQVSGLRFSAGMRADAGEPVLTLLPERAPLMAYLYVPSRAIGFVAAGQPARLMYEAYPFQKFGVGEGKVASVSRSPVKPDAKVAAPAEPMYLVKVRLKHQTIAAFGQHHALRAGMVVRADLILEKRTVIEWLLDPVLSSSQRLQ